MTNHLLRLLAYRGNAAARELVWRANGSPCDVECAKRGCGESCWRMVDLLANPEWVDGLLALYMAAAPKEPCECLSRCPCPDDEHATADHATITCACEGTGKVSDPYTARQRLAAAVARGTFNAGDYETCCDGQECGCQGMPTGPEFYERRLALDAVDAWLEEPSEERRAAVEAAVIAGLPGFAWHLCMSILDPRKSGVHCKGSIDCAALEGSSRDAVGGCAVELASMECEFCAGGILEGEDLPAGGCPDCRGTKRVERDAKEGKVSGEANCQASELAAKVYKHSTVVECQEGAAWVLGDYRLCDGHVARFEALEVMAEFQRAEIAGAPGAGVEVGDCAELRRLLAEAEGKSYHANEVYRLRTAAANALPRLLDERKQMLGDIRRLGESRDALKAEVERLTALSGDHGGG